MDWWREARCILNTRPLPQYPEAEDDDVIVEVVHLIEFPERASSTATEEAVASNPPLDVDEPTPIALNKAAPDTLGKDAPINLEEEELVTITTEDTPLA